MDQHEEHEIQRRALAAIKEYGEAMKALADAGTRKQALEAAERYDEWARRGGMAKLEISAREMLGRIADPAIASACAVMVALISATAASVAIAVNPLALSPLARS